MKRISYTEFIDMLTKESICFINSYEEAVIRTEIVDKELLYYVRFKGEEEFQAEKGSGIVAGGLEEHSLITKDEYEQY